MTLQTTRRDAASYTPAPGRQALIEEAIGCILSGRAFPAHLAPAPIPTHAPATVAEGLARIVGGPAASATPS
jgi:hypothetical protein